MGASAFGSISTQAATPPAPGSAQPSYLYADVQSRALWLGVDPTVNPLGAVLIADIVQTQADILAAEVNAKLYTDTQIPTRAPLVHTHYASDILDFDEAVDAAVADNVDIQWVPGTIMLWAGLLSKIGTDDLAGWMLCDGSQLLRANYPKLFANIGTMYGAPDATHFNLPDLRDRFIIGAGNKLPGSTNPLGDFKTDLQGAHAHTIVGATLTEAQLGSHAHVTGPYRAYGGTYSNGPHAHTTYGPWYPGGGGLQHDSSREGDVGVHESVRTAATGVDGHHDHNVFVDIHVATDYRGGNQAHTHGCQSAGAHQHTVTSQQIRDTTPYFALAYIIKL